MQQIYTMILRATDSQIDQNERANLLHKLIKRVLCHKLFGHTLKYQIIGAHRIRSAQLNIGEMK